MAREYRLSLWRRAVNVLARPLIRLGAIPHTYVLHHRGRRTGRGHSTPVTLIEDERGRFLVAPYGERSWVKNVRAAGEASLERSGRRERLRAVELPPEEAAPILREYARKTALATRWCFDAPPDAPEERWREEARTHPVFRLES
jgi:deazaflavin-dependent oxidoreductase (nitroreductase family)